MTYLSKHNSEPSGLLTSSKNKPDVVKLIKYKKTYDMIHAS